MSSWRTRRDDFRFLTSFRVLYSIIRVPRWSSMTTQVNVSLGGSFKRGHGVLAASLVFFAPRHRSRLPIRHSRDENTYRPFNYGRWEPTSTSYSSRAEQAAIAANQIADIVLRREMLIVQ